MTCRSHGDLIGVPMIVTRTSSGSGERIPASFRSVTLARPGEQLVFVPSTAVIVMHAVVDGFVTIEPGTARGDHLLAAAVPAALAALAIWCYPRVRAGARATLALVFGSLALVGAGVAIVDMGAGGPGCDWTGLLLVPAGLSLCALGALVLWRSRKPGRHRYLRRALIAAVAVVAAYELVLPMGIAIVATHKPRAAVEAADLGRPYEEVTLRTSDGLDLTGWYVPSQNGAAVIAFPGREGPVPHARMLARNGYGVLLLDMRGQGESEGDPNGYGWGSSKDVDAAIAFLTARPDVSGGRIGGLGLSVGGEVLVEAAAGNPGLRAVVSEGAGWRSVRESFARTGVPALQTWLQLPNDAVQTAAVALLGGGAPPESLEQLAAGIAPRPVLFVYGGRGQSMEKALTPAYYAAAGQPKAVWEIPEAGHTGGLVARPEEYERRVVGFFDEALLAD
jgi:fermentation-respiration switch protein FrsA (DUF1100 family)